MDTLLAILRSIHPEVDFEMCDSLIDDSILDSLDIIAIISEINAQMDVTIPPEEIVPENFNSAEALWDLIERLEDE